MDWTFNGAAPDNANSPGHCNGADNGWAGLYLAPRFIQLFDEMKKIPNKEYIPFGEGLPKLIPQEYK